MKLPPAAIGIGQRFRPEPGDVSDLVSSMQNVGLLQPVVVTPEHLLVSGLRRIAAAKQLGWAEIPVTIVRNLDEALARMRAERDENTCRRDFTPSQRVAAARALRHLEEQAAKDRKAQAEDQPRGKKKAGVSGGNFPPERNGKSRDKIAEGVGTSARSLEKAEAVVEAAEREPKKFGALKDEMDRTGRVNGVYRKLKVAETAERIRKEIPPLPEGPFRVIVVDPPWRYGREDDPSHRGAGPYPSMDLDAIKAMPVEKRAHDDAILFLWTTNAMTGEAHEVARAWGFRVVTILTWDKEQMGMGNWLRGQTELCVMAVRGKPTVTLTNQTTLLRAPAGRHSEKPDAFFAMVESLCPAPKDGRLEMFARQARKGWQGWGSGEAATGAVGAASTARETRLKARARELIRPARPAGATP